MNTLFEIDQDLARLYEEREEMMALTLFDPKAESDRALVVRGIDGEISDRLRDLDKKVDGIGYLVKEYTARGEAHEAEGKRLVDLGKREKATAAEIKERAAEVLLQRVPQETLEAASQNSVLLKLSGDRNTLKLVKSPPAVHEPMDMSLLPEEFQRITVTMTLAQWKVLLERAKSPGSVVLSVADAMSVRTPDKPAIAARLKEWIPCAHPPDVDPASCGECNGTGRQHPHVPGAHLDHKAHVRIT